MLFDVGRAHGAQPLYQLLTNVAGCGSELAWALHGSDWWRRSQLARLIRRQRLFRPRCQVELIKQRMMFTSATSLP